MSPKKQHLTFFSLPLEVREEIYSYLLPPHPTSHPLPSVGLTSVSHRPPKSAYLNIHPQIADEILEYFYTITTWKLIFSHAFNFFRVDPDLKGLERSHALSQLRRVELVFYCDVLLLKDYSAGGMMDTFCSEIRRRADRACDVLMQAEKLRCVVVSWIDTTAQNYSLVFGNDTAVKRKSILLSPLKKLLHRPGLPIKLKIGHVNELSLEWFVGAMKDIMSETNDEEKNSDEGEDSMLKILEYSATEAECERQAAKLRMLAFDVRQERHFLHREQEEALYWGRGLP